MHSHRAEAASGPVRAAAIAVVPTPLPTPTATPNATATAGAIASATAAARAAATATAAADARLEAAYVARLTGAPLQPSYLLYTVQPGDTVASIARRFHDVAWLIRRRNGGLWDLAPGQTIRVWRWPFGAPYATTLTTVSNRPQFYTVAAGDTLGAIAARLHSDVATLAQQNGLGNGDLIDAGQTLVLHHYTLHRRRVLVPGLSAARLSMGLVLTDLSNLVGIDAALVKAVAWHESGWRMVPGRSGEIGVMQIMPYMAAFVQRNLIGYALDPHVRENNVLEGALLLRYYLDLTHDNTHKTLALYHSGNTRPDQRNGLYIRACLWLWNYYYHHPHAGL